MYLVHLFSLIFFPLPPPAFCFLRRFSLPAHRALCDFLCAAYHNLLCIIVVVSYPDGDSTSLELKEE